MTREPVDVRDGLVLIGWSLRVDHDEHSAVRVTRQLPNKTDIRASSSHSHYQDKPGIIRIAARYSSLNIR